MHGHYLPHAMLGIRVKEQYLFTVEVIGAVKALAHADRPSDRCGLHPQVFLHIIQEIQWFLTLPVQFVHEGHDRRIPQAADIQQLLGLALHSLDRVNHHQGRVHCSQHPVGVFGKVVVPRCIQQVDFKTIVGKLHHRRGH